MATSQHVVDNEHSDGATCLHGWPSAYVKHMLAVQEGVRNSLPGSRAQPALPQWVKIWTYPHPMAAIRVALHPRI